MIYIYNKQMTSNYGDVEIKNTQKSSYITDKKEMEKPTMQYIIACRDAIMDRMTNDLVIVRPFDTVLIPAGSEKYVYSFFVVGRIFLNKTGNFDTKINLDLIDPDNKSIFKTTLSGTFIADIGINLHALFPLITFEKEGKHTIKTTVSVNNGILEDVENEGYFFVEKQKNA